MDSKLETMKTMLTTHVKAIEKTVAQINASVTAAETVVPTNPRGVKAGAAAGNQARADFQTERVKLTGVSRELKAGLNWQEWFCFSAFVVSMLVIGILIGSRMGR
ncbi:MAG: hypothetical protein JWQ04_1219 [Pedosphaera sp.]|nr:hypothetical protein [Pedosphaera sp.]